MKKPPKDTTLSGEAKAAHMLKRLKSAPRKAVPLVSYYTSHSPAPPVHAANPNLPTSTTMSDTKRDYQMRPERRYEPRLTTASPQAIEEATRAFNRPATGHVVVDQRHVAAEVLRAFANDLRTTEPQTAAWADYLAGRIGG
jgi:hypothetical protein